MRRLREHLLCSGILVEDAEWIIRISYEGKVVGEFGCHFASLEEITDGILFRATTLLGCDMTDAVLVECEAVVEGQEGFCIFRYCPDEFQFLES